MGIWLTPREEWVLNEIYENKEILHNKIHSLAQEIHSKDVPHSPATLYKIYKKLIDLGFIGKTKIDVKEKSKKHEYNGYKILPEGELFLLNKEKSDLPHTLINLNQFSSNEKDLLMPIINPMIHALSESLSADLVDEIYNHILILASQIDKGFFLKIHHIEEPSEDERRRILYLTIAYIALHIPETYLQLLDLNRFFPGFINFLSDYCGHVGIPLEKSQNILAELIKAMNLSTIHAPISKEEPEHITPLYLTQDSMEMHVILACVKKHLLVYFAHGTFQEKWWNLEELIDTIFQGILETRLVSILLMGDEKPKEQNPNQGHIPSLYEPNISPWYSPNQILRFRSFIEQNVKRFAQNLLKTQNTSVIEYPPHIFAQLGIIDQISFQLPEYRADFHTQFYIAENAYNRKKYQDALTIFEDLYESAKDEALERAYCKLVNCYKATNQYEKILELYESFEAGSDLSLEGIMGYFCEYLAIMVELGHYKKARTVMDSFVKVNCGEQRFNKLLKEKVKGSFPNYWDWALSMTPGDFENQEINYFYQLESDGKWITQRLLPIYLQIILAQKKFDKILAYSNMLNSSYSYIQDFGLYYYIVGLVSTDQIEEAKKCMNNFRISSWGSHPFKTEINWGLANRKFQLYALIIQKDQNWVKQSLLEELNQITREIDDRSELYLHKQDFTQILKWLFHKIDQNLDLLPMSLSIIKILYYYGFQKDSEPLYMMIKSFSLESPISHTIRADILNTGKLFTR